MFYDLDGIGQCPDVHTHRQNHSDIALSKHPTVILVGRGGGDKKFGGVVKIKTGQHNTTETKVAMTGRDYQD